MKGKGTGMRRMEIGERKSEGGRLRGKKDGVGVRLAGEGEVKSDVRNA